MFLRIKPLFQQPVDIEGNQIQVIFVQLLQGCYGLIQFPGIADALIEKFDRSDIKVFTNCEEFCHRGQSFAGRNIIDISPAVAEVVTHFIFGYALLKPKLGNAFSDEVFVHIIISFANSIL